MAAVSGRFATVESAWLILKVTESIDPDETNVDYTTRSIKFREIPPTKELFRKLTVN